MVKKTKKIGIPSKRQGGAYTQKEIDFIAPDGERYHYLTHDFDLEPGVIAFLYHRCWDIEKYFDNFKNDMANAKAWGKSRECIEQQSLLAMVSYILMRLFIDKKSADLGITDGDTTQKLKHHAKVSSYISASPKTRETSDDFGRG